MKRLDHQNRPVARFSCAGQNDELVHRARKKCSRCLGLTSLFSVHLVTKMNLMNMGSPPGDALQVKSEGLGTASGIGNGIDGCCPVCGKTYKGSRGMRIHWRAVHPESFHSRETTRLESAERKTKCRWSQEETSALALHESRIVRRGCPTGRRDLNEQLARLMSGRTSEAIKSHRRAESYRELVAAYERMGSVPRTRELPRETVEKADASRRVLRPRAPRGRDEVEQVSSDAVTRVAEACSPGPHPGPYGGNKREWDDHASTQPATRVAEAGHLGPYPSVGEESSGEGADRTQRVRATLVAELDPEWLPSGSDSEPGSDREQQTEYLVTMGELPSTRDVGTPARGRHPSYTEVNGDEFDWQYPLIEAILEQALSADIDPILVQVAIENSPENSDSLQRLIDHDLMGMFPPIEKPSLRGGPGPPRRAAQTARAKRRESYARIQSLYKSSRSNCARTVLNGHWRTAPPKLSMQTQMAFWRPLLETPSKQETRLPPEGVRPQWAMVCPITLEEVARHLGNMKDGAAGPDNCGRKDLRKLSAVSLACRFNLWLLTGKAPEAFKHGITVLIPKSQDGHEPKDFRPITMGSILCRLYHKILAERVERHYQISGSQKAFRKGDGLAENMYILTNVIEDRKARSQATNIAFLDVSKAFDSVSHESILLAAASAGIPHPLVRYVRSVYTGSTTRLRVDGELGPDIRVRRGVRQGDPLSPVLFNSVVDLALRQIDQEIGVSVATEKLSCLAFADDLVLLATTPRGLQTQFERIELALGESGLDLNAAKSATIRIDVSGKSKRWICNPTAFLLAKDGQVIKAIKVTEDYRYLGNAIGTSRTKGSTVQELQRGIAELSRAPLKPQQRLFILRKNLIPSLYHTAVLGRMYKKSLKFLDQIVRAAVRSWLRLPNDTPLGLFHAHYSDGGLDIPPLLLTVPLLRTKRMGRLVSSQDPIARAVAQLPIFERERKRWSAPLAAYGVSIRDGTGVRKAMGVGLHMSVDGRGLTGSRETGFVNKWMVSGDALMSGHSFVNCVRLKCNLPYTRARAARGRPDKPVACDACRSPETLAHILQSCPRTSKPRVDRHDRANKYLTEVVRRSGFATRVEPAIPTPAGIRYPDLVVWKDGLCVVVDTTIVADHKNPDDAHERKVRYYDQPAIRGWCESISGVAADEVKFSACVLTWRGVPSVRSVRELRTLGVTKSNWLLLSVKALEGGIACYSHFTNATVSFCYLP